MSTLLKGAYTYNEHGNIYCPNCFRLHTPESVYTFNYTCYCEFNLFLDYKLKLGKHISEQKVKGTMLYNLRIRASGYGTTSLFEGSCLTYEQCDSIIQKLRQHQKDVTEAGSEKRQLIIEMTPTKFQE